MPALTHLTNVRLVDRDAGGDALPITWNRPVAADFRRLATSLRPVAQIQQGTPALPLS